MLSFESDFDLPMTVTIVEAVGRCMKQVIFSHLAYPGIFAVGVAVEFTFEAVVLNFSSSFAQVLVDFFVTYWVVDFNAGLAGSRTLKGDTN